MTDELIKDFLQVLVKHGIVTSSVITAVRNEDIKLEYKSLRASGMSGKEARKILSEKDYLDDNGSNYRISEKQIQTILYGK